MLREAAVEIEAAPTWAPEDKYGAQTEWQSVDRALRTIARRRAALDADEARWLREAEAIQIWRPLGMVSALDYMERVLGLWATRGTGSAAGCARPGNAAAAHGGTRARRAVVQRRPDRAT